MNTTTDKTDPLTKEQIDARQLAAAERQAKASEKIEEGQRRNTEETRKGKTAQRGDTFKELEQKELTGQINLVKFWGGVAGNLVQQSAIAFQKEDQEVMKIAVTAAGFLSSTALGAFEAHRTLGQIISQKASLGAEMEQDRLQRKNEETAVNSPHKPGGSEGSLMATRAGGGPG